MRKRIAVNRAVTTIDFDKKSISYSKADGTVGCKPKIDMNGVIICKSTVDKEAMPFADKLRYMKQTEYARRVYASDADQRLMDLQRRQQHVFIVLYF